MDQTLKNRTAVRLAPVRGKTNMKDNLFGWITVGLPLLLFVAFSGTAIVIAFITQFCSMEYYDLSSMQWNDFANFTRIFSDGRFGKSLLITLWLMADQVVSLLIALAVSVLLSRKVFGSKIFQILFFVPYICSTVAVSIMFMNIFDVENGIVNSVLVQIFSEGARVSWRSDPAAYTWQLFLADVWRAPGYGIVMYKAAIGAVDPALYEAAKMDGAGGFTQFRKITLPSIAPTTFYLIFAGLIAGIMSFDIAKMFAGNSWTGEAGVDDAGLTSVLYSYIRATTYHDMPGASVISFVLFFISLLLTLVLFKVRQIRSGEAD